MKVQLSGAVAATIDGHAVDLGGAKSQAIFAALALNPASVVPVARIIELVWGDNPPRTAEKTLQSYVTRLRRSCGADAIERVGDAYRLAVSPDDVDLVTFDRLLDDDVAAAVQIWHGSPLAGLASPGFDPIVARFTERFLGATETLIQESIDRGNGVTEIGGLRQLVAEHPLRERLWALLMTALYLDDRQADALRAYSEAREHLVEGLGLEPGPALQSLERRILDHDPTLEVTLAPNSVSDSGPGSGSTTFVFTDIEDSTGLWARHPDEMITTVAEHDAIISDAVDTEGGTVFKHTGDGMYASFPTSAAAVQACVAAQLKLRTMIVGAERLNVRISISTGRADHRDGDWFGPPLNIAARLLDASHGGQILLAHAAYEGLQNDIAPAITSTDLGLVNLRGLTRPEQVHQLLHPALARRFPPLRTLMAADDLAYPEFPPQLEYQHGVRFIGRSHARSVVGEAWSRANTGQGPELVLLAGEPGVGKTRLAAVAARKIHDDSSTLVVYGRCAEDHPSPFRPFTEALTAYGNTRSDAELRTEMGPWPEYLAPVMPLLLDRFADLDRVSLSDEHDQLAVFDAVTKFLEVASSSPLVLVLDDLHWADAASLNLLRHLVRHLTTARLLILATYRDVEVDRSHPLSKVLADLRREPRVTRLAVRGVDADESVQLTEAILGHELSPQGRQLAAQAGIDAAGNPFFLQEMLRHFMDSGVLVRSQGRWTTVAGDNIEGSVPEGIREVVGRRLDHVSDSCDALLRTASALEDDIDVDLLVAVDGIDENDVLDQLDEALEAGLLIDGHKPGCYEFSHALIRQTLYREFSIARRLRLHRRIADALVETGRTDNSTVEAIAHHYLAGATASDPELVARWARTAATSALERAAFQEAAELLRRAVDVTEDQLGSAAEVSLLAHAASALIRNQQENEADKLIARIVAVRDQVTPDDFGEAVLILVKSVSSLQFAGLVTDFGLLFDGALNSDTTASVKSSLRVEQLSAGLHRGDVDLRDLNLESMDDDTLGRAIAAVPHRLILSREQLAEFRQDALQATQSRSSATLHAAVRWMSWYADQILWTRTELDAEFSDRGRLETLPKVLAVGNLIRRGQATAALDLIAQIDGLPQGLQTYPGRWVRYESDIPETDGTPRGNPRSNHFASHAALMPHMRTTDLRISALSQLIHRRYDPGPSAELVHLAWEAKATALAPELWRRLEPARGLAISVAGNGYVTAADFYLGLLAEMLGRNDDAIGLHLDALVPIRDAGFVLDQAYIVEQLVRLLGIRNESGDLARAHELAAEALKLLEPTPYARRVRVLNETLAAIPAAQAR